VCRGRVRGKEQGRVRGKEQRNGKGVAARCDRLGYFVDLYFPRVGHYPRMKTQILSNKINKVLVFP
jgi:hypothetical protein